MAQDIKVPFKIKDGVRIDDTQVHQALREALANCLVNADYYGRQGVVIIKSRDGISLSNPGGFRVEIDAARSGGVSDPRNGNLLKMFNLIDIGERAGSGIPSIFSIWNSQGWTDPVIIENFEPERITLSLEFEESDSGNGNGGKIGDKKSAIKIGDKKSAISSARKEKIIEYLTDHGSARSSEIAEYVDLRPSRVRDYLGELVREDIVVAEGANRNRT